MDNKLEYIPGDLAFHYIPKTIIKKYVKVYVCSTQNALSFTCTALPRYSIN